jgi:hypothetical protein
MAFACHSRHFWLATRWNIDGISLTLDEVNTEQLTLLNEASKLAGLAHCKEITAPFNCTSWCSNFPNTTLIQVWTHGFISEYMLEIHHQ